MINETKGTSGKKFVLQWHLTARCEYNCQHCYMHDEPTYKSELANELDFDNCIKIIDDFDKTLNHWGLKGEVNFTGGDPLIKEGVFEIIKYARGKNISIGILGNPDKIDYGTAKKLKDLGVSRYQISIDGLEKTHDNLRGKKGAFKKAIGAIHILEDVGIPSVAMFTLSRVNSHELIDVIRLVDEEGVSIFDFARLVPIGAGKNLRDETLTSKEYRQLLLGVLEEYRRLKEKGSKTFFGRKEHLWLLLYQELGLLKPLPSDKETIFSGCGIGINLLVILADGTVYPCRRLPIKIGKVPGQSLFDIFINSEELNKLRDIGQMKKCGMCELKQFCRGCPAVAYGATGSYFGADPQCWKEVIR